MGVGETEPKDEFIAAAIKERQGTGTPHLMLGPFYPLERPRGYCASLLADGEQKARSHVQRIILTGRVVNRAGRPVIDALVEIWHADSKGQYRNPSDSNTGTIDPGFLGYGAQRTGEDGHYRFITIKPGAYEHQGQVRAPHIHFQVTGKVDRLVTQMFFSLEPLNAIDRPLNGSFHPELLMASIVTASETLVSSVSWNIVLNEG